jgi:hypothetical protein
MRYLLNAKVRPERQADLLRALEDGSFGDGFPYGDLGEMICTGRVDEAGVIRWVEVCYCREYYGVAMYEELPYLEKYLTDIEVADARSPDHCEGYPTCNDCDCTRKIRVEGEPLLDHLRRTVNSPRDSGSVVGKGTRWLGWRRHVVSEEVRRNRMGASK